ncbi:hypothetical protein GOP47_0001070 [Adiantum capillus-veneris]|uniref:Pentatricopeptide repeat-containing protein n=1 Tax=Adiantum capillus-veneris TaxID=13818 RepID=A0A9D4VE56_ADICA|nr:hypothetical protein GOP47_0001070 [Adiantum capillus-veneris]
MSKLARSFQARINKPDSACASLQALHLLHQEGKFIAEESIASLSQEISASESLPLNRGLHSLSISHGFEALAHLGDPVIRVFASRGSLLEACLVFSKVAEPSVYTWQAIIAAHLQQDENALALFLYNHMQYLGTHPNKFISTSGLKASTALRDVHQGKSIHIHIVKSGSESDQFIESALVDLYLKCGNLDEAQKVFILSKARDNVLWSAMISGYAQCGCAKKALQYFSDMQRCGEQPNHYTFSCVLKACSSIGDFLEGTEVYMQIVKFGLESDTVIGNALICMYTSCKCVSDARHVFDRIREKTIASWGAMLAGYAQHGYGLSALGLFMGIQNASISPNRAIYLHSLKACSSISAIKEGMLIHDQVLKSCLDSDVAIGSGLVDVYIRCGCLEEGHKVHQSLPARSIVTWGALIYGCVQHGYCFLALELLRTMQHEGLLPDKVLYLCSIKANGSVGDVRLIKMLHAQLLTDELISSDEAIANALLDAYAKSGHIDDACRLFEQARKESLISCSSMIGAYAQHGQSLMALKIYKELRAKNTLLDRVIFLSAIKACSSLGALGQAKELHDHVIRSGIDLDTALGNSLVDMYSKCGVLLEAGNVLDRLPLQDEFSWGAMIGGHVSHGHSGCAKQSLDDMHQQGIKPNGPIYCSLLSACNRAGAVMEGLRFFDSMKAEHGILPTIQHFTSIIDLLCRSGLVDEARRLLFVAQSFSDLPGWTSLLSACRSYGMMNLGFHCLWQVSKVQGPSCSNFCNNYHQHRLLSTTEGDMVSHKGLLEGLLKATKESDSEGLIKPFLLTGKDLSDSNNCSCYFSFIILVVVVEKIVFPLTCIFTLISVLR